MTTYTWLGASGPFTAPSFWRVDGILTGGLPGTADTALFPGSSPYSVSGATGVDSLIVTDPAATIAISGTIGLSATPTLDNAGTLAASGTTWIGHYDSGAGAAAVTFANTGTITGDGTTDLTLFALVQPAGLGTFAMGGGMLRLGGSLDNTGATLSAAGFGAGTLFIEGTVNGGTLLADGHLAFQTFAAYPTALLLNHVTLRGSYAGRIPAFIQNGLTVTDAAGTGPGTIEIGVEGRVGPFPGLHILDSETLDAMTLKLAQFAGTGLQQYAILAEQTLTLGPTLQLHTMPIPGLGFNEIALDEIIANTLVSNAAVTLDADLQVAATLFANNALIAGGAGLIIQGTTFLNAGTIQAGGTTSAGSLAFDNTGLFDTGAGLLQINGLGNGRIVGATVVTNDGTLATSGGTIEVNGNVAGTGTIAIANGGTANLRGLYSPQVFALHGTGNLLQLGAVGGTATLTGFVPGDTIGLTGTPAEAAFAAGTLTLSASGIPLATFALPDVPANAQFLASVDGSFNTTITETIPCFAAGTRIATPRGPVPVEHLRPGDHVLSAFGGSVPVKWVGRRAVWPARHRDPAAVWPIRIRAGALAQGIPARDLFLSPDHALHLDGHLVPAALLVNGTAIAQEPRDAVTYFHIELPQHDVLLAEGAPCESYLDTANRADFDNAGPVVTAHPGFASADDLWRAHACAPQCRQGPTLAHLRARLAARAATLAAPERPSFRSVS